MKCVVDYNLAERLVLFSASFLPSLPLLFLFLSLSLLIVVLPPNPSITNALSITNNNILNVQAGIPVTSGTVIGVSSYYTSFLLPDSLLYQCCSECEFS